MTPSELSRMLANDAERVARNLLPNGKKSSGEWKAGNVQGDAGQSLSVELSGEHAGRWKDFATGEGGDLIDLFMAVNGVSLADAIQQAKQYLGVKDDRDRVRTTKPKQSFKRPERPASVIKPKPTSPVREYLHGRGLTDATLDAYRVAEDGRFIVFPFLRDNELVFLKWLGLDRENGKKKIRASAESEPCLFGWQAIPANARTVTITEGEIDAMSATQSGYPALSVPFGGGAGEKQRWIEYEYDRLQRFDVIYLAMDNDEAGNEGTQEIIKRLGRERCMIVRLPSKDWNECLMASIPDDVMADCYANAESLDPDKLVGIDAFAEGLHHLLDNPMETGGLGLPWDKAEHLIRLRGSETTIWTGWNGHGKSQLLGFIAVSSLIKERVPFCIASMEMKPTISLLRMVRQAAGVGTPSHAFADAILDAMRGNLWIYDQLDSADIIEMLSAFKYAAKRYSVKHFIVDSLAKLGIGEEDYDGQKKAINALTNFAHEMDVHVHLVAHPRKGMDEDRPPNKMDVRGGASLTDMADNVITVWRNKPKEREAEKMEKEPGMETKHQDEGDVRLIVSKQRGGTAWEGTIALWFDRASFQYMGRESHKPHPMVAYSNRQEVAA
tara:strand:- start:1458 stop:3290 length:1833 start_codon:yes stop_codon:yes gene_type:complete